MTKQSKYKSYTWLLLFLPSLSYYIYRLSSTYFSAVFLHVESNLIIHNEKTKLFPTTTLELVSQNYTLLNGITWYHDTELGRGYILVSDVIANRIWKWEVGGGPITIGKSLHMERSGCRSRYCNAYDDKKGSGALSILPELDESSKDLLLISEYGEERLIKLENDGARNPLLYDVKVRDFVILPPLGDIIYINEKVMDDITSSIWKVKEGVNVPAIPATDSRAAHDKEWKGRELLNKPESIFNATKNDEVVGIVMLDWDNVIVTARLNDTLMLLNVFVGEEKEDDYWETDDVEEVEIGVGGGTIPISSQDDVNATSDDRQEDLETDTISPLPKQITILKDISSLLPSSSTYTKIGIPTLDTNNNIYIPIPNFGIVILDTSDMELLYTLQIPSYYSCNQVTIGDDYYLYMLCESSLMRVKMLVGGKKMEKDLYKKKKVKKVL